MRDLYIYYQVREADAPALLPRVAAMQAALARQFGVAGQLKRRPEVREGLQTWMEVYPGTGEEFGAALAAAVEQAQVPALIAGARHVEVFMDMPPCA
ncbi:MAG TPA: DUF4936 family protein [Burkholderiaceae bacterium]|nr:DUF4936 family protein [Burkholderiaceae bacterium]